MLRSVGESDVVKALLSGEANVLYGGGASRGLVFVDGTQSASRSLVRITVVICIAICLCPFQSWPTHILYIQLHIQIYTDDGALGASHDVPWLSEGRGGQLPSYLCPSSPSRLGTP